MNFISASLADYAESHTSPEPELLKKINRETHANVLMPRMLSGHMQGRFLAMISHMICPQNILEIGTYTGYSAICLAEGLTPDGRLITIDINEELQDKVQHYFEQWSKPNQIDYRIGDALSIIPTLDSLFDLVWIDADKQNYLHYYDLVFEKVRPGGFILADNVLWSGKILEKNMDKDTQHIQAFNDKIQADKRVENVLLPVRDGITLIRKI